MSHPYLAPPGTGVSHASCLGQTPTPVTSSLSRGHRVYPASFSAAVLGPAILVANPQPHGQGNSAPHCDLSPPARGPSPRWAPAHLRLPLVPRDLAKAHGALGPWSQGAAPCRWADSAGYPAGGPRTQGMGQGQRATESPGRSLPHSQEKRTRKGKGWM